MDSPPVRAGDIAGAVRALGLQNQPVRLHSSLRSFGFVEGGAETIVQSFLNEGCTVMVPAFTDLEVAPPVD